jgi:hypothetical protein
MGQVLSTDIRAGCVLEGISSQDGRSCPCVNETERLGSRLLCVGVRYNSGQGIPKHVMILGAIGKSNLKILRVARYGDAHL